MPSDKEEFRDFGRIEQAYEKYRNSGLALMALVISISFGAFVGLYRDSSVRCYSFVFVFPVSFALLQQLMNYFGSKYLAQYRHAWYVVGTSIKTSDDMTKPITDKENARKAYVEKLRSNFFFGLSDSLCWLTCAVLVASLIYPFYLIFSFYALALFLIVLGAMSLLYLYKRRKLDAKINKEWPEAQQGASGDAVHEHRGQRA